jgi:ABC-2 type transport system permease protein
VVLIITLLLTIFVLNVPVEGSFFWMILVSMLYIILSLGIGLLVSSIVKTQIIATLIIGMVFLVPVMMMSGMLYPVESMPYVFQLIAQIIPAKWYIEAIRKIMIEGVPFVFVLKETLVLLAMTVVIFTAAVKKFNDRIE